MLAFYFSTSNIWSTQPESMIRKSIKDINSATSSSTTTTQVLEGKEKLDFQLPVVGIVGDKLTTSTTEEAFPNKPVADAEPPLSHIYSTITSSINARIQIRMASMDSPVRRYCTDNRTNGCFEPSNIEGEWVLLDHGNTTTVRTNNCPGWNFGMLCNNGYAANVNCPAENGKEAFLDEYVWEAENLPLFSAIETCQLLGDRTILLIGDSTMGQTASTLINRLYSGGCQKQIHFKLSDTLVKQDLGADSMPTATSTNTLQQKRPNFRNLMNRGPHWTKCLQNINYNPDIVIFGLGAHIYGEERWKKAFDEVVDGMIIYQHQIRRTTGHVIHFVYKTISPGGCSQTIALLPPDKAARTFPDYTYNHATFYGRDLYALARLKQIGWPVLDLRMLYARTDAHTSSRFWPQLKKDCLHLCTPGPLDVVADLMQELLMHELSIGMK